MHSSKNMVTTKILVTEYVIQKQTSKLNIKVIGLLRQAEYGLHSTES